MGLSNDLISQFAKLTVGDKKTRSEATVFGTVKDYADSKYVMIDGSELLTPVSSTTDILDGDRVTVLIKDHTATITGNLSSPSARLEHVEGVDGRVTEVEGVVANVDKLVADEVEAQTGKFDEVIAGLVQAEVGKFDTIIADKVDAEIVDAKLITTDYLTANYITAEEIKAGYITADQIKAGTLDAKYANIDFTTIGEASVKKIFADYGIIEEQVSEDLSVTKHLKAVVISGDLIEANTLKADKLVIKGTDGLFYRLNVSGVGEGELVYDEDGNPIIDPETGAQLTVEQTDENSIDGTYIQAKSITATKINVSDLVAFDATIGGFQIDKDSIHSHGKGSTYIENENGDIISQYDGVHNTNPGIYMDDIGQVAFGDADNYIKYYKDDNDQWKLKMAASEFSFQLSNGESVDEAIAKTIVLTEEEFYQSTSPTELTGGETDEAGNPIWSTTQPTWTEGTYIWRRTKNTYNKKDEAGDPTFDYTPSENGVCITGNTGAAGNPGEAYTVTLTNSNHTFAGDAVSADKALVTCEVEAYKGSTRIPTKIIKVGGFDLEEGRTLTTHNAMMIYFAGNDTTENKVYVNVVKTTDQQLTTKQGVIQIVIEADGITFNRSFAFSVALQGEDGAPGGPGPASTVYSMDLSSNVLKRTPIGTFNPMDITLTAKSQTGDDALVAYEGRFKIETTASATIIPSTKWDEEEYSVSNVSSRTAYPSSFTNYKNITAIRCSLYKADTDVTADDADDYLIDRQIVPVVSDSNSYTMILSNESHTFAGDTTAALNKSIDCYIEAYKGGTKIPTKITKIGSTNITTSVTSATPYTGLKFTVKNNTGNRDDNYVTIEASPAGADKLTTESGTVTLTIQADGQTFTKDFSFSVAFQGKQGTEGPPGSPGTAYSMISNLYAIVKTPSGTYIPNKITLYGRSQSGVESIQAYAGRFKIAYATDGDYTPDYESDKNESEVEYTIRQDTTSLRCQMYLADGFNTMLDELTIPVVSDGKKGDNGDPGADAYTIVLSNDNHTFAGSETAAIGGETTCKVFAYKGIELLKTTIGEAEDVPDGMTFSIITNDDKYSEFKIVVDANMTTKQGTLTIPITVDSKTFEKEFTYSLALAGKKGDPGRSITGVTEYYLVSNKSSGVTINGYTWYTAVQTPDSTNKYLWNYEKITYNSGDPTYTDPIIIGVYGDKGDPGRSITGVTEYYLVSNKSSGVTINGYTWYTSIQTMTSTNKYLWNYEKITYNSGDPTYTDPIIIGVYGDKGDKGSSVSSVDVEYYLSTSNTELAGGNWSTDAPTWADGKYVWTKTVTYYDDNSSSSSDPVCINGAKGSAGKGISSIVEEYYQSSSNTSQTGGQWSGDVPTWVDGKYIWTRSVITYTDNSSHTTDPVCVTGGKGNTGKGVSSTSVTYASSTSGTSAPSTGWNTSIPAVSAGSYLWTKTVITYTDSSTSTSYSVSKMGNTGKGISSTAITYQSSTSGTTTPSTWLTYIPTVPDGSYLWTKTVITYTDSSTSTSYSVSKMGKDGNAGRSITGVTEYYLATSASSGVTRTSHTWYTAVQTMTSTNKYLWNYEMISYDSGDPTYTDPIIIGTYGDKGDNGRSITGVTEYYLVSNKSSGVTINGYTWNTSVQTMTSTNKYLWNYEMITYNSGDPTYTNPIIIGVYGDSGKGVSSTSVTYASSTSGTSAPSTGWNTSIPAVSAGSYLWTKTVITYTDSSTSTSYSVSKMGDTGKGVSSATITYASSTSGTSAPSTGWNTSIPAVSAGSYLWTKTVITYTDSSTSTSYSVAKMGNTGKGVSSTSVTYASSTSGTSAPSTGWNTSIPAVTDGSYLWTKTVITYTDSSTSTSYSVAKMGENGVGISNTTVSYAASTSGTTTPSTWYTTVQATNPGEYLWTKTTFTYSNGSSASTYTVSRMGKDGQTAYGVCGTNYNVADKTVTLSTGTLTSLYNGATVTVKFSNQNTTSTPTLKVNMTDAKIIKMNTTVASDTNPFYWRAGSVFTFVYDGSNWVAVDAASTRFEMTSDGFVVGNWSNNVLANNVCIGADSVDIRGGTNGKTVYAKYGANTIYLGMNSPTSEIDLCNGTATMKLKGSTGNEYFDIHVPAGDAYLSSTHAVCLNATHSADVDYSYADVTAFGYGSSPYITMQARYHGKTQALGDYDNLAEIKMLADENSTSTNIQLYAMRGDNTIKVTIDPNMKWDTTGAYLPTMNVTGAIKASAVATESLMLLGSGGGLYIGGTLQVDGKAKFYGDAEFNSSLTMANGKAITSKNSSGSTVNMIYMGSDDYNILNVGGGANPPSRLYLGINGATLRFYASGTTTAPYYFLPAESGKYACGTSSYYWYGVYTKNFTKDLSDGRKKENIIPFGQSAVSTYSLRSPVDIHSEIFDRLKPVQYNHIDDNGRTCYGLIAQDVIESITELGLEENELDLVHHEYYTDEETNEEKDTYSIAYTNLIAMLIHEVQKLKSRVDELENI